MEEVCTKEGSEKERCLNERQVGLFSLVIIVVLIVINSSRVARLCLFVLIWSMLVPMRSGLGGIYMGVGCFAATEFLYHFLCWRGVRRKT